jgi:outer membrane lipoprotein-sorting protein
MIRSKEVAIILAVLCLCGLAASAALADEPAPAPCAPTTVEELQARITEATKNFADFSATGVVREKNKKAMSKIEPGLQQLYESKSANIFLKAPDKLKIEGKLGMVRAEYIISGTTKLTRAPQISFRDPKDYKDDPPKLQDALDIGLITSSLWKWRKLEIQPDPDADKAGEIKLRYYYPKGDMIYLIWLDAKDLWLKRFEKREANGNLRVKVVYSMPMEIKDVIWAPTRVEMFAPDGERAGMMEYTNIRVNAGVDDKLFE